MSDSICPVHDGRSCVMACISCTYMFVCDRCIEGDSHRGHQLLTFDSASKCVMKNLRQELDTNALLRRHLESDLVTYSLIIQKERDLSESRLQTIIRRRESIKRQVDLMAGNLLQINTQRSAEVLDQIDAEQKNIQASLLSASDFDSEVTKLLACENATDIIAHGRFIDRPDIVRGTFPVIERTTLTEDSTEDDIKLLFGKEVVENVKLSYPSFFNEDGTFVLEDLEEICLSNQVTQPVSKHENISKCSKDEDNENVHLVTNENQDIVCPDSTKNEEADYFSVTSENLEHAPNLPFLPFLETEICDDADEADGNTVTQLPDGNLPCQNMKHFDNFLHFSDEFSQSESTCDESIPSSVSTLASDLGDNTQHRLDEKKYDILPNEEEVFIPAETTTEGELSTCVQTPISSSLESLTVFLNDHQEVAEQGNQDRNTNVDQETLPNTEPSSSTPVEENMLSPIDIVSEEQFNSYDEESDTVSLGKGIERGESFKQNYFDSVNFKEFDTNVKETADTLHSFKNSSNASADIDVEPAVLRPKPKTRELFPSKEFPIMERKSKEIHEGRTTDKLNGNKANSDLPSCLFEERPVVYRTPQKPVDLRRTNPNFPQCSTLPTLRRPSFPQQDPSARLKLKQTFSIDSPVIIACPITEERCWLSSFNRENEIVLVNRRGRVKRTIQLDTLVLGMTMLDSQLLVCCRDEMCIKQVLQNFQVRTFFSTAPLCPSYICSGFTDEMFVTLTDKTSWSIELGSTSVVVKYSGATCQEMARAQLDRDGDDLFFLPSRICLNKVCRTVAVINYTSPSMSHLVLLDSHMTLILRYIDHNKVILVNQNLPKITEKFFITDVRFDPFDNIIIAEHYTKEIQLLDKSCQLLRVLVSEQATPWSLALYSNGHLWVGFDNGMINVYSSKLKSKRVVSFQRSFQSPW
ncbi:uncharacterized protein LOC110455925 [Mizuhopecten yessoensis]|uniref:B box-type domain-containing protein n=1 Tax=Mizuhopecten yessoensis TaxID=6573 RepID=A0A210QC26_MIZYE|nr:uncharacterized protein LOC110455925 [Mizuhopecten yessoensis]OWF46296.1 hypothetical protein KP79_PYT16982 [Mizuhopecten yessoensis]